mgnify:CR=1 FL=1
MNRLLTAAVLAVAGIVTCFAADASAEPTTRLRLQPHIHHHQLPTFGFYSNLYHGNGYYVTGVSHFSAAHNFGLECADTITGATVNGHYHSLAHGGWQHVVREAMYSGGHIKLHVRDVNSGYTISRWTNTRHW